MRVRVAYLVVGALEKRVEAPIHGDQLGTVDVFGSRDIGGVTRGVARADNQGFILSFDNELPFCTFEWDNICWQVLARQVIDSDDDVMDQFLRQHQREPFAAKCLAERLAGGVAFSQLG